jgi:glucose-6-phosphate isomerase, archaeal
MSDIPFSYVLPFPALIPSTFDNHIERRLSSLRGQFRDSAAYEKKLAEEDCLVYEVFEIRRPELAGELPSGVSIVHPGKIGAEFFMTKGHFHHILDTAEIYMCLKGEGCMVMETPEGETRVEALSPGSVLYIPPRWAHRSVCTSRQQDLVTFFAYPGNAGHDYSTIERQGFGLLVLEAENGAVKFEANPRWKKS